MTLDEKSLSQLRKENMESVSRLWKKASTLELKQGIMDMMNDVYKTMNAVCIVVSDGGIIEYSNRVFEDMVGLPSVEVIGQSFADFLHPEDLQRTIDIYAAREAGVRPKNVFNRYKSAHTEDGWQWIAWPPSTDEHRTKMFATGYLVTGPDDDFVKRWDHVLE